MLATIRLAQLVLEAGFPPGVFNVVTGMGPTVGAAMVKHPLVDKVFAAGFNHYLLHSGTSTHAASQQRPSAPNQTLISDMTIAKSCFGASVYVWHMLGLLQA